VTDRSPSRAIEAERAQRAERPERATTHQLVRGTLGRRRSAPTSPPAHGCLRSDLCTQPSTAPDTEFPQETPCPAQQREARPIEEAEAPHGVPQSRSGRTRDAPGRSGRSLT
jgi:hypothetical protein